MAAFAKLKDQGWFLTEDGIKKLTENNQSSDYKEILNSILDTDLREIGGGALPFELNKGGKIDSIPGNIVLQVCKISNAAAPKSNPESNAVPRLLKIELTDGQIQFPGLEYESVPSISLNTPPGTKILLKNGPIKISNGFLLFSAKHIDVIGGKVAALIEKWDTYRMLTRYSKSVVKPNTGAPSWSMFGKTMEKLPEDKTFKSLTPEQEKENAEFNELRKNAIDEAMKIQKITKKEFGRGKSRIMDHNIQKIIDKGYTVEQAKYALKLSRNNLERAFASLKRQNRGPNTEQYSGTSGGGGSGAGGRGGSSGGRGMGRDDRYSKKMGRNKEDTMESKPSGKLSLFDFLENKLPQVPDTISSVKKSDYNTNTNITSNSNKSNQINHHNKYQNNYNTNSNKWTPPASSSTRSTPPQHSALIQSASLASTTSLQQSETKKEKSHDDDKTKFENNISASFRQKKEDPPLPTPRINSSNQTSLNKRSNFAINNKPNINTNSNNMNSNHHNMNNHHTNENHYGGGGGYNQGGRNEQNNNYHQSSGGGPNSRSNQRPMNKNSNDHHSNMKQQQQNNPAHQMYNQPSSQQQQHNDRNQKPAPRFQSKRNPLPQQQQQNMGTNPSPKPAQHQQHSYQQNSQSVSYQTNSMNSQMNNVTENMNKMNLNNNTGASQQQHQHHPQGGQSQQHQQQQQNNNFSKVFPQVANGYGYNPYKIIGFQNKETNEFARNVLKQEINFSVIPGQQQQQHHHQQTIPQQHQQQPIPANIISVPSNFHHPPPPQPHHIQPTGATFLWKVGDRCLAKYWEDGRFYAAKITGISERTFVVNFLEYGNYEEVLKTDILPFNEQQFYHQSAKC